MKEAVENPGEEKDNAALLQARKEAEAEIEANAEKLKLAKLQARDLRTLVYAPFARDDIHDTCLRYDTYDIDACDML